MRQVGGSGNMNTAEIILGGDMKAAYNFTCKEVGTRNELVLSDNVERGKILDLWDYLFRPRKEVGRLSGEFVKLLSHME